MFIVIVKTNRAVFEGDANRDVARLLREIANRLDAGEQSGQFVDGNGNNIAGFGFDETHYRTNSAILAGKSPDDAMIAPAWFDGLEKLEPMYCARLLAAAPELLEACKVFVGWARASNLVGGQYEPPGVDEAVGAIVKAEGAMTNDKSSQSAVEFHRTWQIG
jgi:hypothetical protein